MSIIACFGERAQRLALDDQQVAAERPLDPHALAVSLR